MLRKMVFDILMTGNGEFALVFVKLKLFGYLHGGWMLSESVLVGLPFPSRQSFRVNLLLEPFQLMIKFTRHRLYIFSDHVHC